MTDEEFYSLCDAREKRLRASFAAVSTVRDGSSGPSVKVSSEDLFATMRSTGAINKTVN